MESGAEEKESKVAGRTESFGIYRPLPLRNWESGEDIAGSFDAQQIGRKGATTSPADCGGTVSWNENKSFEVVRVNRLVCLYKYFTHISISTDTQLPHCPIDHPCTVDNKVIQCPLVPPLEWVRRSPSGTVTVFQRTGTSYSVSMNILPHGPPLARLKGALTSWPSKSAGI